MMTTSATATSKNHELDTENLHGFVFDVDGISLTTDHPTITGAQILVAASLPPNEGLVLLHPDGTTSAVGPDDEIHLVPGAQFKRRPRFKRG
jgi:hypothetical protein